jgi:thioredoxin 1
MNQTTITKDFEQLMTGDQPLVLDFYADWCAPCRIQGPIFAQAEAALAGQAVLRKVNIEREPALAAQFGVMSIPTIAVVKGGKLVFQNVGVTSKDEIIAAVRGA